MSLIPVTRDWQLAAKDVRRGLGDWHVWLLLGLTDIRQRYMRSRLGQFWITLSMALFVAGIGTVYSVLFKQDISTYLPYLAVNYVVWSLIQGILADACYVFTQAAVYLRQEAMPRTTFVMRLLVRNLIMFAHNLIIVPIVFVIFGIVPRWEMLAAIPGLMLFLIASYPVVMLLGALSTRFRDMPVIITNLLQIAFFVTPVMWHVEQLGDMANVMIGLNPFAIFMRIVSEPLNGRIPGWPTYTIALVSTVAIYAIAAPFFARFRARIVYWL